MGAIPDDVPPCQLPPLGLYCGCQLEADAAYPLCDVFYVTKIDETFEADRYFPDLDEMGLKAAWESELQEEKGITYRFLKYVRENNR